MLQWKLYQISFMTTISLCFDYGQINFTSLRQGIKSNEQFVLSRVVFHFQNGNIMSPKI